MAWMNIDIVHAPMRAIRLPVSLISWVDSGCGTADEYKAILVALGQKHFEPIHEALSKFVVKVWPVGAEHLTWRAVSYSYQSGCIEIILEHPEFEAVQHGNEIPLFYATATQ